MLISHSGANVKFPTTSKVKFSRPIFMSIDSNIFQKFPKFNLYFYVRFSNCQCVSAYFCIDFFVWGVRVKRYVTRGVWRQKVMWRYVGGGVKMMIFSVTGAIHEGGSQNLVNFRSHPPAKYGIFKSTLAVGSAFASQPSPLM